MADTGENLSAFERYGVILQRIEALTNRMDIMDAQWTHRLDRFEVAVGNRHDDHEDRIRIVEGRSNLIISIGIVMWVVSIIVTWFIARGGP